MIFASLILSLVSYASCDFPSKAEIQQIKQIEESFLIVEKNTQCLFSLALEKNKPIVLWSKKVTSLPSDLFYSKDRKKVYIFYPQESELRSVDLQTLAENLELSIPTKKECTTKKESGIEVETCRSIQSANYKISILGDQVILYFNRSILSAYLGNNESIKSLQSHDWYFWRNFEIDQDTGRVLSLENLPSGESIISWFVLTNKQKLLAPIPNPALVSSGIQNIYYLFSDEYFLTDTGLIYKINDFNLIGSIGYSFQKAFIDESHLITLAKEKNEDFYKANVYSKSLRKISFEYFFKDPLYLQIYDGNKIIVFYREGTFDNFFRILPLRGIGNE